jgi:hypothetical protein
MNQLLFLNIDTAGIIILLSIVIAYFGLVIFSLLDAVKATFNNSATKIVWVLVILLAPFLGSILYLTIGRSSRI